MEFKNISGVQHPIDFCSDSLFRNTFFAFISVCVLWAQALKLLRLIFEVVLNCSIIP